MFDFVLKGTNSSQLEKELGSELFPPNEHYFGLVNVRFNSVKYFQFINTYTLTFFSVWKYLLF